MASRRIRYIAPILLATGIGFAGITFPTAASQKPDGAVQAFSDVRHDTSPPLADLIAASSAERSSDPAFPQRPRRAGPDTEGISEPAGLGSEIQTSAPANRMPGTVQNFEGMDSGGPIPPDTNGDVGPTRYVESVNTDLAIYDKAGNIQGSRFPGNALFDGFGGVCESTNDGDPIIQYDPIADRWVFTQFANVFSSGPYSQCFAVSTTGSPSGSFYRYQFLMPGSDFNDYPKIGVWSDAYYMTTNQFGAVDFTGVGVFAFDRTKMLAGMPATMIYKHLAPPNYGLLPSDLENSSAPPPAGTPNHLIEYRDLASGDELWMYDFNVNWATPASSTLTGPTRLAVKPFDPNACQNIYKCIPQRGTSQKLDSITDLLMYQFEYYNYGSHEDMTISHAIKNKSQSNTAIRWYQLRSTGAGPWMVFQQGTFAPDGLYRWLPSGALDSAGNLAIGYNASSSKRFPSIRYAGRLAGDPANKLSQGEAILIKGGGSQGGPVRWGDYSAMQIDPTDGCTFWYTNEYYSSSSATHWRTRVGSFSFPSC